MAVVSGDQRDELDLLDQMKKSDDELKWDIADDKVIGVMVVSVDLSEPTEVLLDTSRVKCPPTKKPVTTSVTVAHLPPIKLHFHLPKDYPEKSPPSYNLSCSWLNFSQLSIVCRHLDQLWNENEGCVILYQWQQFLICETLQVLQFHDKITVAFENPIPPLSDWDPRGIQEMDHALLILPSLIEYNEYRKEEEFKSSRFTCEICFLSVAGTECVRLRECEHIHCKECMKYHVIAKISDGSVTKVDCPASECTVLIPPDTVKHLVPIELFKRYDQLLLQRTLDSMCDIVYCPRLNCMCVTVKEDDCNMAVCPRCKFSFCSLCKRTWHGISPCKLLPDDLKELKEIYDSGDHDVKYSLEQQYGRSHLLKAFEEYKSHDWIKSNSKSCPNCKANIEKSHGCNKMTCTHCSNHFCWLCEALLSRHNPYVHFHYGNSSCAGKLFDGAIPDFDDDDDD